MNHCKDCKHFKERKEFTSGLCENIYGYDGWGSTGPGIDVELYAADDTGLECEVAVTPDFGCIKFEEKSNGH